ncbi:hypothetical protein DTQ70_29795 [Runella sp. SP2]|nr:hypothetical protein DTQ70_29795 [Runella sp. SP2]
MSKLKFNDIWFQIKSRRCKVSAFVVFWDSKIFSMFEVYSKLCQVMEDKLLELLRNFYPTETFNGRNDPTTQRIQELIRKGYKEGKHSAFLDEIENKYGEKYRINTFRESSWAPSFGFVMECSNETTTHQVSFYASILASQYCYFVKSYQKIGKPAPPKDENEKAFYTKLGGLLDQERR